MNNFNAESGCVETAGQPDTLYRSYVPLPPTPEQIKLDRQLALCDRVFAPLDLLTRREWAMAGVTAALLMLTGYALCQAQMQAWSGDTLAGLWQSLVDILKGLTR